MTKVIIDPKNVKTKEPKKDEQRETNAWWFAEDTEATAGSTDGRTNAALGIKFIKFLGISEAQRDAGIIECGYLNLFGASIYFSVAVSPRTGAPYVIEPQRETTNAQGEKDYFTMTSIDSPLKAQILKATIKRVQALVDGKESDPTEA
ncbi:MAG: hypothetical protein ACRC5C_13145 [Bacilli bacterium]